jgi:hypothetical protein
MMTNSHSRSTYGSTSLRQFAHDVNCIDPGWECALYNVDVGRLQWMHIMRAIAGDGDDAVVFIGTMMCCLYSFPRHSPYTPQ